MAPWILFILLFVLSPIYIYFEYKSGSPWVKLAWKAACSLLFVLTAIAAMLTATSVSFGPGMAYGWFLSAFLLSAAGDVLLSLPGERSFMPGLAAFFLAHVAFVTAFSIRYGLTPWDAAAWAGLAGAALITLIKAPGMDYGKSRVPVMVYALALSAMAAKALSGIWTRGSEGALLAAAGGLLFYASDVVLAFILFNRKKPAGLRAVNLALYYAGQGLLAISLLYM